MIYAPKRVKVTYSATTSPLEALSRCLGWEVGSLAGLGLGVVGLDFQVLCFKVQRNFVGADPPKLGVHSDRGS